MAIVWRDALSVGNDAIDADHRHLIALINTLELALTSEQPFRILRAAIEELRAYTHDHFAREERIMLALGYVTYDAHKHAHGVLIEQLDDAAGFVLEPGEPPPESTSSLSEEVRDKLTALLRSWLLEHIVREDLQLKPLLARHPKNFSA